MTRLLIAGGGTGGHLYPGVAVAEELLDRESDAAIHFVGTKQGIEARVIPALGWDLSLITVSGIKTVGMRGAIAGVARIPGSLIQSRRILRSFQPDVVIGVGGYASGPVVLAAKLMGIRTAILEQNSIPGVTNKMLGKVVDRIFLSFPHSESFFSQGKCALVGNPIRKNILQKLRRPQGPQAQPRGISEPFRLFIFGGSQGAQAVNEMCCHAAALLTKEGHALSIVHQTGPAKQKETQTLYKELAVDADCHGFIEDMAEEYRRADLIIARAGATTIAELAIVGKPAILIPYPFAANNHQEVNAQEMARTKAAITLSQEGTGDRERLAQHIKKLMQNRNLRETMGDAMRALARPDASAEIVDFIAAPRTGAKQV